jgi:hypothetical protein
LRAAELGDILCVVLSVPTVVADSRRKDAKSQVQRVVRGELAADAKDHSHWMFRDTNGNLTVKLTIRAGRHFRHRPPKCSMKAR